MKHFSGRGFTGGTEEHVRAPSLLMEKSNSMRIWFIPHAHVMDILFLCHIDLYVTHDSKDLIQHKHSTTKQSLLLVQNDQYVESEQVIAEICAGTSPFKERVRKHIDSDSEGEMHWSTDVYHAPE